MQKNEAISSICSGEIVDLKIDAVSLAENILVCISVTEIFPNMGFVQKHSK